MRRDGPERFLALLRDTHPDFEYLFTHGGCYHLYLILRELWPDTELWYAYVPGHVYARIGGCWYDIRGKHLRKPKSAMPVTVKDLRRPDRWKKQLARMLDRAAVSVH